VQTGGTFRSLIVSHGISTTYAVISKPIATFRGAKSVQLNDTKLVQSYLISVYAIPVPNLYHSNSNGTATAMPSGLPWYDVTVAVTVWQNWTGFEGGGGVESNATYNVDLLTLIITGIGSGGSHTFVYGIYQQVASKTTVTGQQTTIGEVKQYCKWELNLYYEQVWCDASACSQFNTYQWNITTGTTFNKWISFF
jgi:hypothetical protein